jgi:hypothetical protein
MAGIISTNVFKVCCGVRGSPTGLHRVTGGIVTGWYQCAPRAGSTRGVAGADPADLRRPCQRADDRALIAAGHGRTRSRRKTHRGTRRPLLRRLDRRDRPWRARRARRWYNHHDNRPRVGVRERGQPCRHRRGGKRAQSKARPRHGVTPPSLRGCRQPYGKASPGGNGRDGQLSTVNLANGPSSNESRPNLRGVTWVRLCPAACASSELFAPARRSA